LVVLLSQLIGLAVLAVLVVSSRQGMPASADLFAAACVGLTGAVGLGCFYTALAIGAMSVVAPITATGALVPVVVGIAGGDSPGALQAVGMVAAVVGILLVTQDGQAGPGRTRTSRLSIALAFAAALTIGVGLVAIDRAVDSGVLNAAMWARVASVALLLPAAQLLRPSPEAVRGRIWPIVAVGLFDAGALTLYAVSTTKGLLSIVAVMASLYPVVTVLLARVVLSEEVRRIQAIGIACALSGVAVVGAGG
jgi:drug/metabolite transporter (DMT)-like permease